MDDVVLWIVVGTALAFDFTNGFHDTANAVATSISTRAMPPRLAVGLAASLNFVGAFLSLAVAATIASGIVDADYITPSIVFAGLIGAIAWNLATWYFGLPSSSSHALIGGVVGSAFVAEGPKAVYGAGIVEKVIVPALVAPVLALVVCALAISLTYRIVGRRHPGPVTRGFRLGQTRLGQPVLALARHERRAEDDGHHRAGAGVEREPQRGRRRADVGRALGGHGDRARDLRRRLADHQDDGQPDHQDGPGAGLRGADRRRRVILSASHAGFPLSTTHVMTGGIMGAGAAKRLSAVRWGVAGNIAGAWVLTLPASAAVGGLTYAVVALFGAHQAGPMVVSIVLLLALTAAFVKRIATGRTLTAEG